MSQGVWGGRDRLADLQFKGSAAPGTTYRKPVDQLQPAADLLNGIAARIELPRLPVLLNNQGMTREEEVDLRPSPRAVSAGIVPFIALVECPCRVRGRKRRIRSEEVLVAPGSEQSEHSSAVRQNQKVAPVRKRALLDGLITSAEGINQS
jgi:hypothetical protein